MVALEHAWSTIRARHHELPPAVAIVGSGSVARSHGLRLGHFSASRWHDRDAGELSEIFIAGEGLDRGATDVLSTLLHEGAHALAHARAIKDTSRQCRYHNIRFKRLAEELGLELQRDPQLGWSLTLVPEATHTLYAKNIAALARAMTMHRSREFRLSDDPPRNGTVALCDCGRRIRVAPGVLAQGAINFGVCRTRFRDR